MDNQIVDYFISLVTIDSESRNELEMALKVKKDLEALGAKVYFDNADKQTGGNVGNLCALIPGNDKLDPILFSAHLDTVVPGKSIKPQVRDGVIYTDGTTILGADDKSGITQIIYGIKSLQTKGIDHPPIEILFTVCEEVGLLGVKNADLSGFKAKTCYAFDTHQVGAVMIGAPSQNNIILTVKGKKSHAGSNPDKGLNSIVVASDAITKAPIGRIDEETTANIGIIKGGEATNIVPDKVVLHGEVRSHSEKKLSAVTDQMCDVFRKTVTNHKVGNFTASVDIEVIHEYDAFCINENEPIVRLATEASKKVGLDPNIHKGGGGSDANILNQKGIQSIVVGTGMNDVHTTDEHISIEALQQGASWVEMLLTIASKR